MKFARRLGAVPAANRGGEEKGGGLFVYRDRVHCSCSDTHLHTRRQHNALTIMGPSSINQTRRLRTINALKVDM